MNERAGMTSYWFEGALLADGWADRVRLTVRDGHVATLAISVEPEPSDERHGVAVPGIGNLHSHAFQRGMAGMA